MGKGKKSPDEMTFFEHLGDLRKRLFYSFIAVVAGVIPAWFFSEELYEFLERPLAPFLPEGEDLIFLSLPDPFMLYIKISFLASIFFMAPFIFYQLWHFVAPGLYKKEKKYVWPFVAFTSFFFLLGGAFGYFIVLPVICRFFLSMGSNFKASLTINQYFTFTMRLLLGIALVFEIPTLVLFLSRMGIISAKWMIRQFKYAVLVVFIIAAIITPTPDFITQSVIAIPMLALYGFSILVALLVGRGREKKRKKREEDLAG